MYWLRVRHSCNVELFDWVVLAAIIAQKSGVAKDAQDSV